MPTSPTPEWKLAWAAGFFEGEGYFAARRNGKYVTLIAGVGNTDLEQLLRFQSYVGVGHITKCSPPKLSNWKQQWRWQCQARTEVAEFCDKIDPYLGSRRKEQLRKASSELSETKRSRVRIPTRRAVV